MTTTPWQPMETAPKDGTKIAGSLIYRWTAYKPQARKIGYPEGRWQRWNGYGWENAEPPEYWMPLPPPPETGE